MIDSRSFAKDRWSVTDVAGNTRTSVRADAEPVRSVELAFSRVVSLLNRIEGTETLAKPVAHGIVEIALIDSATRLSNFSLKSRSTTCFF